MIVFYLYWSFICHYLDDIIYLVVIFKDSNSEKLQSDIQTYNNLIVLLGMPNNGVKQEQGSIIIVFGKRLIL